MGDFVTNLLGIGVGRAVMLAAMPFVTRIYGAEDYGAWAILLTFGGFLLPFATLRYELAMVLAPTRLMAAGMALAIGGLSLVLASFLTVVLLFLPETAVGLVTGLSPGQQGLLILAPIILLILAARAILEAWATREKSFKALAVSQLALSSVTAGAMLLFPIFFQANAATLIAAALTGMVAPVVVLLSLTGGEMLAEIQRGRICLAAWVGLVRYKVYPQWILPYSLSAFVTERIILLILASQYSLSVLGAYYMARQLVMMPANLFATAFKQVLFSHGAQKGSADIGPRIMGVLAIQLDVLAPVLGFILIWLTPIIALVMGDNWAQLADFSWWIIFPAATHFLAGGLDRVLDILGRQRLAVALQVVSDVVIVLVVLTTIKFHLNASSFVAAISISTAIIFVTWVAILLRKLNIPRREVLGQVVRWIPNLAFWIAAHLLVRTVLPAPWAIFVSLGILSLAMPPVLRRSLFRIRTIRKEAN